MAKSQYETKVLPKLILVEGWARDGLIDEQIAKNLGIGKTTFYAYIKKYPALSERLKKGKEVVDTEVENALLKRAMGYSYKEVTSERVPCVNPNTGELEQVLAVTKEVIKEVQPDVTAQIFWLKNRKSAAWADKQEIEQTGDIKVTIKVV